MIKVTYELDPSKTTEKLLKKHKEVIPMPKDPIVSLRSFAIITFLFGVLIAGLSELGTVTPGRSLEIAALGIIQAIISVVALLRSRQ